MNNQNKKDNNPMGSHIGKDGQAYFRHTGRYNEILKPKATSIPDQNFDKQTCAHPDCNETRLCKGGYCLFHTEPVAPPRPKNDKQWG